MSIELSAANFEQETQVAGPVIVDFWAGWCEPCTVMRPEVEAVAEKLDGRVKFFSVDAEDKALRPILLKEDVEGIPSMAFFKEGKLLDRLAGYKKAAVLESLINEVRTPNWIIVDII